MKLYHIGQLNINFADISSYQIFVPGGQLLYSWTVSNTGDTETII